MAIVRCFIQQLPVIQLVSAKTKRGKKRFSSRGTNGGSLFIPVRHLPVRKRDREKRERRKKEKKKKICCLKVERGAAKSAMEQKNNKNKNVCLSTFEREAQLLFRRHSGHGCGHKAIVCHNRYEPNVWYRVHTDKYGAVERRRFWQNVSLYFFFVILRGSCRLARVLPETRPTHSPTIAAKGNKQTSVRLH